jgi:hypothetical protein
MTETVTGEQPAIADQTPVVDTEVSADPAPAVAEADDSSARPKPDGLQKRFDKLTWEKHELARERDFYREQAMRQTPAQPAADKPEAPKKPPTLAEFDFDETKYQAALVEHVKAETARELREEFRKEQAQKTQQERLQSFSKREQEFASKHKDYLDLTRDRSLPISQTMADLVQETESGPEILYYLANNRDEAMRIAQMDERSAARAIGRIESKLEKAPAPAPAPKPVSKAPPPPPQIEAVEPAVSKDPSEMTDAEFAKWRKRQIAQRR